MCSPIFRSDQRLPPCGQPAGNRGINHQRQHRIARWWSVELETAGTMCRLFSRLVVAAQNVVLVYGEKWKIPRQPGEDRWQRNARAKPISSVSRVTESS